MATYMYCSYCASPFLVPYKTVYKCQECGRIVIHPIIIETYAVQNEPV